jgi:hypothetical protein
VNTRWSQALSQSTDPATGKVDRAALYAALCLAPDDPLTVAVEALFEAQDTATLFADAGRSFIAQLAKLLEEHSAKADAGATAIKQLAAITAADRKKTEELVNAAGATISESAARVTAAAQRLELIASRRPLAWAWFFGGVATGLVIAFAILFFR